MFLNHSCVFYINLIACDVFGTITLNPRHERNIGELAGLDQPMGLKYVDHIIELLISPML